MLACGRETAAKHRHFAPTSCSIEHDPGIFSGTARPKGTTSVGCTFHALKAVVDDDMGRIHSRHSRR